MKLTSVLAACIGVVSASTVACGGAQTGATAAPVVTNAPDDFVLRDVRKDAARHLACQVPNVGVTVGPWAGSEGNVTAYGCGYELNYYVRCVTNHHCSLRLTD